MSQKTSPEQNGGAAPQGFVSSAFDALKYKGLLDSAATNRDGLDYANSTTIHAEIAISKIIEVSTKEIFVFSTNFCGSFWNMLKSTISGFLKESPSRTFRVITAAPLDKDSENMVSELTEFYPRQFSVRTLEKGKFTESPNFLFGDDFASRYEDNDRDAKLGLVSAVVNFGNKSRVNNMRAMFARIEQYVEKG